MKSNRLALVSLLAAGLLVVWQASVAFAGQGVWTARSTEQFGLQTLVLAPDTASTVYAIGPQNILVSRDGGVEWAVADESMAGATRMVIVPGAPPATYVVANGELFRRESEKWIQVAPGLLEGLSDVAIHPLASDEVWVGARTGLLRSRDGGKSWSSGGLLAAVRGVVLTPSDRQRVYVLGEGGELYYSENGGESWDTRIAQTSLTTLVVDGLDPSYLYGIANRSLVRSTDGGANFNPVSPISSTVSSTWPARDLAWTQADGGTLFVTNGDTIHASSDHGATWRALPTGNPKGIERLYARQQTSTQLYALALGKVFSTVDGGASWAGPPQTSVQLASVHPLINGVLFANENSRNALRSADEGLTWDRMSGWPENLPVDTVQYDLSSPGRVLAATAGALYISADDGLHWKPTDLPPVGPPKAIATAPGQSNVILVSLGQTILRSADGGASWLSSQLPSDGQAEALLIRASDSRLVMAATNLGLMRSSDGGATWTADTWRSAGSVERVAWRTLGLGVGKDEYYADTDGGLLLSGDGGLTWMVQRPRTALPADAGKIWTDAAPRNPLFYTLTQNRVYASPDGGVSWIQLGGALPAPIQNVGADGQTPRHLYASDQRSSLWRYTLATIPAPPAAVEAVAPPTPRPAAVVEARLAPAPAPLQPQSPATDLGTRVGLILAGAMIVTAVEIGRHLFKRRRRATDGPPAPAGSSPDRKGA